MWNRVYVFLVCIFGTKCFGPNGLQSTTLVCSAPHQLRSVGNRFRRIYQVPSCRYTWNLWKCPIACNFFSILQREVGFLKVFTYIIGGKNHVDFIMRTLSSSVFSKCIEMDSLILCLSTDRETLVQSANTPLLWPPVIFLTHKRSHTWHTYKTC